MTTKTGTRLAAMLLLIMACSWPSRLTAMTGESFIGMLDFSGFFRVRSWNALSRTFVPEKFESRDTYRYVDYIDLFIRNRFNLAPIQEIEIRTVFDISANFGKDSYSIDGSPSNFITRNVYGLFRPVKGSELSIGLLPFSLPGGHIIARDATGLHYV
ncbi:MAG: hypothetical protein E4G96_02295, partial [Chrysiogenales bacterium]